MTVVGAPLVADCAVDPADRTQAQRSTRDTSSSVDLTDDNRLSVWIHISENQRIELAQGIVPAAVRSTCEICSLEQIHAFLEANARKPIVPAKRGARQKHPHP